MQATGILLGLAALALAGFGFLMLSQATFGVGLIGIGAICAILARIAQADAHHAEAMKRKR